MDFNESVWQKELQQEIQQLRAENERLTKLASDRLRQRWDESKELRDEIKQLRAENERLQKLCLASLHLLKGSDAIYDPRGDVGPTHWLATRDRLIAELEQEGE